MKRIFIFWVLSCLVIAPAIAAPFTMPKNLAAMSSKIITLDKESGQQLWQSAISYKIGSEEGQEVLLYQEQGSGKYAGSKLSQKWTIEAKYYTQPYLKPVYSKNQVFDTTGKLVKLDTFDYNYQAKKVYFVRQDLLSGKTEKKTFALADGLIDKYALGLAIIGYSFADKKDFKFKYISDEPQVYDNSLVYRGKEQVVVPAGTFQCHKLELTVDLGLLGVVGAFLPKIYFWYSDTDPAEWVKYEGLESGLGTPYVVMQLY